MPDSPFIFHNEPSVNKRKTVSKADYDYLLQRYNALYDGNFDMVYIHDAKGNLLDVNQATTEILGYSKKELLTMNILDLVAEEHVEEVRSVIKTFVETGSKGMARKYRIKHPSGDFVWINARSNVLITEQGETLIQGFAHDITAQVAYESRLLEAKNRAEESDKLKSAFLSNMSHEIRTPLNAILGFADIISNDELDISQVKNFSGMILKNGEYLLKILSDIIDVVKIESNQISIAKKPVNLTDLLIEVDSTMKNSQNFKSKKGVKLIFDYGTGDDIILNTDEIRLKQILFNLLNNALKFTTKGEIRLSYSLENELVHFIVSDSGIGIPKEFHDKIFKRFGQAEINNPLNYGGSGLGLSICLGISELLGGTIWFESVVGKGSDFHVTIPVR